MGILKNHSFFRQSVDIWRFGHGIANSTSLKILDSGVHTVFEQFFEIICQKSLKIRRMRQIDEKQTS